MIYLLLQAYDVTVGSRVVTVVQSLLAPDLNSVAIPSSVRAHAFVVLGKLCLASEPLAKRCISKFYYLFIDLFLNINKTPQRCLLENSKQARSQLLEITLWLSCVIFA